MARGFEAYGVSSQVIDKLLDPEFNDLRLTQDSKFWMLELLEVNFASLEAATQASIERASRLSTSASSSSASQNASLSIQPYDYTRQPHPRPNVTTSIPDPLHIPEYTTLYKGLATARLQRARTTSGIDLSMLATMVASDFGDGRGRRMLYFGVQKWVAERYCKYMKHSAEGSPPVVILRLDVPNHIIERIDKHVFSIDDSWKIFVHYFRHGKSRKDIPNELQYLVGKDLLIGPICKTHSRGITRMSSWREISDVNVLHEIDGDQMSDQATQYAFKDTEEFIDHIQAQSTMYEVTAACIQQ